jgi:hypothetical protein
MLCRAECLQVSKSGLGGFEKDFCAKRKMVQVVPKFETFEFENSDNSHENMVILSGRGPSWRLWPKPHWILRIYEILPLSTVFCKSVATCSPSRVKSLHIRLRIPMLPSLFVKICRTKGTFICPCFLIYRIVKYQHPILSLIFSHLQFDFLP